MHRNLTPKGLTFWGQWTLASSLVVAVLFMLVLWKTGQLEYNYRVLAAFTILASLPAYSLCDVYSKKDDYAVGLGRLFMGWLLTIGILFIVGQRVMPVHFRWKRYYYGPPSAIRY
jgi:putative colanic acid biosynthesis UDP-glucose lipid carrier transferase